MRARYAITATLLVSIAFAACSMRRGRDVPNQDRELITRAQLDENHFQNAYDAVQALRSNWLQTRGTDSFHTPSEVIVYYDAVRLGGIDQLRTITTINIGFIRHFNGTEATSRWGVDHGAGVILVSSRTEGGQ